jgi:hypothetical protein
MGWVKMKALIFLMIACASAVGAGLDVQVITTAKTNADFGTVSTKDVFLRGGMTNVVRDTKTKGGVVQIRLHRFYHDGLLIGEFIAMPKSSGFTTEAGSPYAISFEFSPSGEVQSAVIGTNGIVVDAFSCTNGVFSPADATSIRKANAFTEELRPLFSPAHVTNTPPEDFGREVERFIEEHKGK